jgi:hypothetical protein
MIIDGMSVRRQSPQPDDLGSQPPATYQQLITLQHYVYFNENYGSTGYQQVVTPLAEHQQLIGCGGSADTSLAACHGPHNA